MSCTICNATKDVSLDTQTLNIGTIADNSANVLIEVTNATTGFRKRIEATSTAAGMVALDMGENDIFASGMLYEIKVYNLSTGATYPVTISDTEYDCFTVKFKGGCNMEIAEASLEPCD